MEDNPFDKLKISPHDFLDDVDGRSTCSKCGKSRKFFCYTCYVPVKGIEDKVPQVKLPFKIDIIKHPSECDGKSTSAHAGVIAPDDVTIYTYPCIPDYPQTERVVLLFPGDKSVDLSDLAERFTQNQIITTQVHDTTTNMGQKAHNNSHQSYDRLSERNAELCPFGKKPVLHDTINQNEVIVEKKSDKTEGSPENPALVKDNGSEKDKNIDQINDIFSSGKRKHNEDISVCSCDSKVKRSKSESFDEVNGCNEVKRSNLTTADEECCQNEAEMTATLEHEKRSFMCKMAPFDRAVVIDSTWNQTKRISSDERLKDLTCVELKTRESHFWRHQKDIPSTYLSTIEAIYYLVRDYDDLFLTPNDAVYDGKYDNLLFFFSYMYKKIRKMYDGGKNLKAYKQRAEKSENKI